jgi:type I restriction-modification system DNA methylase subunit
MSFQTDLALPLSLTELQSHLWESANILRGPVDAADFKIYIFPLLSFSGRAVRLGRSTWVRC